MSRSPVSCVKNIQFNSEQILIMNTNNNNEMNNSNQREDFETLWNRRQQSWQERATKAAPGDEAMLRMAEKARHQASATETPAITITKRRNRWLPYAAAATLVIGVATIGLTRHGETDMALPIAKEVNVDGQTIRFVCNNGCSAQDIVFAANQVIKD